MDGTDPNFVNTAEKDGAAGTEIHKCLEIEGLWQRLYDPSRSEEFSVYVDQNITLYGGDFVALLGPSGCGKTTLLTVLGLLRAPTAPDKLRRFSIWCPNRDGVLEEVDLRHAWIKRRRSVIERIRQRHIGFALQSGELISSLTVRENIAVPLYLNCVGKDHIAKRVDQLIDAFRLRRDLNGDEPAAEQSQALTSGNGSGRQVSLAMSRVNRLSGGEYQRVALARAVAHQPTVVYVDEPTSALNRELARSSLQILKDLQSVGHGAFRGVTVMITHDEQFAAEFSNVIIRMAPRANAPAGEVVEVTRIGGATGGRETATLTSSTAAKDE